MERISVDADTPIYVISMAAQLAQMHPQTLRQYDRLGLVVPQRQGGKHRRYSSRDVQHLRRVAQLSSEGISLEGIRRMLDLERQAGHLQRRVSELEREVEQWQMRAAALAGSRVFAAGSTGEVSIKTSGREARERRAVRLTQLQLPAPLVKR